VISVTPRPHFTPGERTPGTHWTGGWVGPRAGLDTEARGKIFCLCQGSNPDRPVAQSVVRHYTDFATSAPPYEVSISYVERFVNTIWGKRLYIPSEERCAADFYRPRPGFNPRTLGPMASTLTIRPPRTTNNALTRYVFIYGTCTFI
jgi:hypothetical protein